MARKKKSAAKKTRRNGRGRRMLGGVSGTALQATTGAVAYLGHYALNSRVDILQRNWWATPAIMGVAGHLMKRRPRLAPAGYALIGAAGYAMGLGYSASRAAAQTAQQQQAPAEAGALVNPRDTGALIQRDYDTGVAGYLDDADNPTSAFYRDGSRDGSGVAEAMGL
jgi:hypothetical protein